MSPDEAEDWGVIPALVEAYQNAGINALTVGEWVRKGIMPKHARLLIKSGASLTSPKGHLPLGAADPAIAEYPEDSAKWYDGFDSDWPEREAPYDPEERYYLPDDARHPYSPIDPFDPDAVVDPHAAENFVDDFEREAPHHLGSPVDGPRADRLGAENGSVSPRSVNNVIPLFRSRPDEEWYW